METEVRGLRQEVARAQDSLRAATRRCRELVRELDGLSTDHERERLLRDQQLSRILRALLVLESRLKQEQKSIRQLLCEKDNVIRNQQLEIARLRRYTKSYIKGRCAGPPEVAGDDGPTDDPPSLESSDFQVRPPGLYLPNRLLLPTHHMVYHCITVLPSHAQTNWKNESPKSNIPTNFK
jgi:hypothetical protein